MKILIVTHLAPFPQTSGYPIVVGNTIRGLTRLGHEVALFSLHPKKQHRHHGPTDDLAKQIKFYKHNVDTSISFKRAVSSLFNRSRLYTIERYYNSDFERLLVQEVKLGNYDIIQFEGLFVTPYLAAVRKVTSSKIIYRAHHIEHLVWERMAMQKGDPFKRSYLKMIARRVKKFELQQLLQFDGLAAFTDQDSQLMLQNGAKVPVEVLPVGLDLSRYQPDLSKTEFPSLFFLGAMDWMPNREGIEWFLDHFSKEITDGDLRVRFYVAGNDIPERFDDYEVMGKIYIQGEVDDALEFVNSKAIMIVPLLSGGGMRVKIVEGMAMQKCIISTSLGAEGISYENGENILIANTQEEFFKAIKRCISDENFCKRIGRNAREQVRKNHDTHVVTQKLVEFYQKVLSSNV
ncbi:glycosyltransferase family 4 protein [Mucilaginibacter lacusdianchii]|uniref:glycosyltransferase family 4 protein n=1 Tax=Mucilaginibacter lacusdianchii TaxID=2684211 RepID=UPI00131B9581|nr:glycosyltransferase family 4 protein [Mucilaginibacter sp. JXJ CY 39]